MGVEVDGNECPQASLPTINNDLLSSAASNFSKVRGLVTEDIQPLKYRLPLRSADTVGRRNDDLAKIVVHHVDVATHRINEQPAAAVIRLDLVLQRTGD